MSFTKCFLLFLSFTASVSALATPHAARSVHHRHVLAARGAAPVPVDVPHVPLRKRASGNRCRFRSISSTATLANTPALNAALSSTPEATSTTTTKISTTQAAPSTTPSPSPTPTVKPATTSAAAPTAKVASNASSGNLPSFMVGTQTGQGTFYSTGLGACGITNSDTDYIAAVSHLLFDAFPGYNDINPNSNPLCGKKVRATYQGKSVTVAITDRCEGCAITDLDFSPSAFNQLADFSAGRISGMTWIWA